MSEIPILGKAVVLSKSDGVKKYGILKSVDQSFVVLTMDSGKDAYIPVQNVGSISLDERAGK